MRRSGLLLGAALASAVPMTRAAADSVSATCIGAFDEGQRLQSTRRLRLAREALLRCARQECPAVIRSDCSQVLREVEAATPTIVLKATDAESHDLPDVRVDVDGVRVADVSSGAAVAVDPGKHAVRFEQPPWAAVDVSVLVGQGEKNRLVSVVLGPPRSGSIATDPVAPPRPGRSFVGYAVPIALGAAGAVTLTVAGVLRAGLANDVARLEEACGSACPPERREPLHDDLRAANVALGVGIGLLVVAVATWVVFLPQTPKRPAHAGSFVLDGVSW